jgi:hypothetical protein
MHVNFSMNAPTAMRYCARNPVIAAYSVRLVPCRARQFNYNAVAMAQTHYDPV